MKTIKNNKGIIIAIIVFVLLMWGYNVFFKTNSDIQNQGEQAQVVGKDVLELLAQIQTVQLNTDVLNSDAYKYLYDFGSNLVPQPVGRINPFDIVGRDSSVIPPVTNTSPKN